ncbi:MAG: putative Ig domain-containing protein [Bryobacteraceae bacterium]
MKRLAAVLLLTAAAALPQSLPRPTIVSMSPSAVTAPSPGITLQITGTRFRQDSRVVWRYGSLGATPLETTFLGETQLRAAVPASFLQDAAQIPVAVTQPGAPFETLVSNVVSFAVFSGLSVATGCPLPSAIVGQPYTQSLTPNGGVPPYSWTLFGGSLPAGLSLSPTGVISGTPAIAQTTTFTLQVADAAGSTARTGCALTTIGGTASQTLFITALQPPGVLAGSGATSLTIRGLGFTPSTIAVWNFGGSPVDLATTFVDSTTLTAAIPAVLTAAPGTYPIAVRQTVLTAQSLSNTQPFTVSAPLTIGNGCPLRDAVVNSGYSEQLTVTGGFAPYVWSIFAGQLPPGLALQREGTLSGTPNVAGGFDFTVAVTDSRGNAGARACSIRVLGPVSTFPTSLSFTADAGGEWPALRDLSIVAAAPNVAFSVTASGGSWLRAFAATSATPGVVRVSVEPGGLPAGQYGGVITIRADASSNQALSVPVSLILRANRDFALVPRPRALRFSSPREGMRVQTQLLAVGAAAPGATPFTAAAESAGNWLTVSPAGNASPGVPATLRVTVSPAGLAPGTHTGVIRLSPAARPERFEVPVVLVIGLSLETLQVSQTGMTLTAVAGGPTPSNRSVHVASAGPNGFFWDAGAATTVGGDWLQVASTANTARAGQLSSAELRARTADLGAGMYFGDLRFTTASADLPRSTGIAMEVIGADRALPLDLSAGGLLFTAPSPAPRALTVRNITRAAVQTVVSLNGDPRIWSVTNADFRTLLSGDSQTVSVIANPAGLATGVYRALLLFQATGPQASGQTPVQQVELALLVPPADCASAQSPPLLMPVLPASGFRATSGLPVAVEFDLVDACGQPVEGGAVSMYTPGAGLSGVALQPFGAGRYAGTWNVPDRDPGPATLAVHAWDAAGRVAQAHNLTGYVEANPGVPVIGEDAIVSAAAVRVGAPLAPGGIFSLFGSLLADRGLAAQSVPLPNQIGATSVSVDAAESSGTPSPLFFAGPTQVNAMLPFTLLPNAIHQFSVHRGAMRSAYVDVPIASTSPAVFTFAQTGVGQGIVVDGERPSILAAPANPIARGGVAVIYCEGLGLTDAAVIAGQASPGSPPGQALAPVTVTIGGQAANVVFAGLTPESVGLFQINAVVPEGIAPGDAVPVVIGSGGQFSRPVSIAVR